MKTEHDARSYRLLWEEITPVHPQISDLLCFSMAKICFQSLNAAYSRGILDRAPLRGDLVCPSTSEIIPDIHWFRPDQDAPGPRYYVPYYKVSCVKPYLVYLAVWAFRCFNSPTSYNFQKLSLTVSHLKRKRICSLTVRHFLMPRMLRCCAICAALGFRVGV